MKKKMIALCDSDRHYLERLQENLEQKDSYEQMVRQLRANITRQEEAIADFETPEEGTDVLENVKDLRAYVKPDRAFAEIFIREIRVYADKRIDVVWNMAPMHINETG